MGARDLLGPADVPDDALRAMVAAQLGRPVAEVTSCEVQEVAYAVPSITTVGRWWVRGRADGSPYAFFVRQVQAWSRSPFFAMVPEEFREVAAASYPWRIEREVYRSDLRDRLPEGLRMPQAYGVHAVDEESYALWLEVVPAVEAPWALDRFGRAAHLLGQLSSSPAVADVAGIGGFPMSAEAYRATRVTMQLEPILRSDIWQHPALVAFDPDLRSRLRAALDRLPELAAEVDALPRVAAHGDACPGNLLVTAGDPDGFTLIDFGQFTPLPVGYDLTQLLVGETMIRRRPAFGLAELEDVVVAAYAVGSGCDEATVRRAHPILLFLFTGLSTVPFELMETTPPPELAAVAAERAAVTRFSLDLLDETS
jgi:hypothetical protein